jgi:hypothetical protein
MHWGHQFDYESRGAQEGRVKTAFNKFQQLFLHYINVGPFIFSPFTYVNVRLGNHHT